MRKAASFLLVGLLLLHSTSIAGEKSGASGEVYKIIVNRENPVEQMSREDLARIYLGKKTLWDSEIRIMPAMLREREKATQIFIKAVVRKRVAQYRAYWKRRLFSGGGAVPKTFLTSGGVVKFVSEHPGAVGVVAASVTEGEETVKVIEITQGKSEPDRQSESTKSN